MSKKLKLLALFCLYNILLVNAQQLEYTKYNWETTPILHEINDKEKTENYIVLKEKSILEFAYNKADELELFETKHIIIRLNNYKGIEEMNKVYISTLSVLEEIDLKARTITNTGKVINLDKNSIKKVDNFNDAGPFTIFAMEGVDVGSEIEYIYTIKKNFRLSNSFYLQTDKIKKNVSIDIYSPSNLFYAAKGYNGFPDFSMDTTLKNKNHIYSSIDKIEALNDEKYAAPKKNKMRYDYQIIYNTASSKDRLYTWELIGNNIHSNLYNFTKQEIKAVDKLISKQGFKKLSTDEIKIRTLEQYLKYAITYKDVDELISIDKMIEIKYGNSYSLQRLYIAAANALKIPFEIVVTTNRFERKFDSNFQSSNSVQEYLMYFPTIGKYLTPDDFFSRLGYPTATLVGDKGIFIKETSIGDIKTATTKVKDIDAPTYKDSYNDINVIATFNPETMTPTIKFTHTFMGYSGIGIQGALGFLDNDKKKEVGNDLSKFMGTESIVKSCTLKGYEPNEILVKPFVVESLIEAPQLIENAGKKYIFKVGDMLGAQEQLYQEKERQTDIDILFAHSYNRFFEIKIPDGYKVKNLEKLAIDKRYIDEENDLASFISEYKVEGDIIRVKIVEIYKALHYPKSNFELFRSVVNAAADFNKIILIFEK